MLKKQKSEEKDQKKQETPRKKDPSLGAHTLILLIIYTAVHFYNAV